jgi:adenosylcobinamide-phosphate synthase
MLVSDYAVSALILALIADRTFGDPDWLWTAIKHPVVIFGDAIGVLDRKLNAPNLPDDRRRRNGFAAIAILAGGAALAGSGLALVFQAVPFGWIAETLIVAVLLSQKSMLDHLSPVMSALRDGDIASARNAVSRIVGRNVDQLGQSGISRAAIESAAENFSDGVVAPAFWYLVLGLPGLLAYKMVNTADSMIGHRNETYARFGYAAARLDDILNFVPARLAALLITLVAPLQGGSIFDTALVITRDASSHASPNAGWPEAAMAGTIDIALGGPRSYGDHTLDAPWLNAGGEHELSWSEISAAISTTETAWFLALIALIATQIAQVV